MKNINNVNLMSDIWGIPDGVDSLALSQIALTGTSFIYVARDDVRMTAMGDSLRRLSPDLRLLEFPAWDCLPFDGCHRKAVSSDAGLRRLPSLPVMPARLPVARSTSILLTTVMRFCSACHQKPILPIAAWITAGQITKDLTNGQTLGPHCVG